ncbi:tRNA pseudouridine(13) synthase TruD [Thiomicrorhabdus indica]|uniref:tRNA pseudouridine(13) synthase TruD n=1 Tax=Thiomicrorhabdus indica TaxID=2267253 RepID=UPI002AA6EEDB|nr:tRNA pseudouridine(13) synthase TruD [Thiomicrorhabdus indica]
MTQDSTSNFDRPVEFIKSEMADEAAFSALNYATQAPVVSGYLRVKPEDFLVEEQIAYDLSGDGEHLWIWVEKTGENSDWVAGELAKWAGVSKKNVGLAGQKDRHAVTRQWFSITLPGKPNPDFDAWPHDSVRLLKHCRHQRKLQKGGLSGNQFVIRLRGLQSVDQRTLPAGELQNNIEQRIHFIRTQGVPNYFGEQRFGHSGNNLRKAIAWLVEGKSMRMKPNQRSLYLSAMRSWVFNQYLSARIEAGIWDQYISGDALNLQGSSRWFVETDGSEIEKLPQRVSSGDLHPTGPLIGEGDLPVMQEAKALEEALYETFRDWFEGLKNQRLKADRRALRLLVSSEQHAFNYRWLEADNTSFLENDEDFKEQGLPDLELSFFLPAGSFATMVLREIVQIVDYQKKLKLVKK